MTRFSLYLAALLPFLFLFSSCDDDEMTPVVDPAPPSLQVRLTDAPGDYDAVLIDIADVQVKLSDGEFIGLEEDFTGQFDLLQLTAGADTLIGASTLPVGALSEVRLILGDRNFVVIDDETIALRTPSAQQSGLKVKFDEDVELVPGAVYVLTIDFDAGRSVVRAGNSGNYNLKPVLRASVRTLDVPPSGITGSLSPAQEQYVRAFTVDGDTLGTYADTLGFFRFVDPEAGTYTVEIVAPDTASYNDFRVEDVVVNPGRVTELGTIELE